MPTSMQQGTAETRLSSELVTDPLCGGKGLRCNNTGAFARCGIERCGRVWTCCSYVHGIQNATKFCVDLIGQSFNIPFLFEEVIRVRPYGSCTNVHGELKKHLDFVLIEALAGRCYGSCDLQTSLQIGASLSSVTKTWTQVPKCMTKSLKEDFITRVSQKKSVSEDYLSFAETVAREVFSHKKLTSKALRKRARRVAPKAKSCTEIPCMFGGQYSHWRGRQESYLRQFETLLESADSYQPDKEFLIVQSAKPRPLVKNSAQMLLLKPLHSYLYDTLSETDWLLRGPPSQEKLRSFADATRFFSADFKSATDSLSLDVAEAILRGIESCSVGCRGAFEAARKQLRAEILIDNKTKESMRPECGQMMGDLTSFPLLCLQNYILSRWVDRAVQQFPPRLINGDDLVVGATPEWIRAYRKITSQLPFLTLNEKKTMDSERILTINSKYFRRSRGRLVELPFIRCNSLVSVDVRTVGATIGDVVRPFAATGDRITSRLSRVLICALRKKVNISQRSLYFTGFRSNHSWFKPFDHQTRRREGRMLANSEKPVPQDPQPMKQRLVRVPEGLEIEAPVIADAMVKDAWNMGVFKSVDPLSKKTVQRVLNLTRSKTRRCAYRRLTTQEVRKQWRDARTKEKKVWVSETLADCLELVHDRVEWHNATDFTIKKCKVCSAVLLYRANERIKAGKLTIPLPCDTNSFGLNLFLFDVAKGFEGDAESVRRPDIVWSS